MLKIPIHKLGRWRHPTYGVIEGTQEKFDQMIQNFKSNVLGRDPYAEFGHSEKASKAVAQAWVKDIVQEGSQLYALAEPTDPAVETIIRKKQIRYSSPEYDENHRDKSTGKKVGAVLKAVGLVNNPFIPQMGDVIALSDDEEITFYLDEGREEEKKHMEVKDIVSGIKEGLSGLFTAQTESLTNVIKNQAPSSVKLSDEDQAILDKAKEITTRELKLSEAETAIKVKGRKLEVAEFIDKHAKAGIPKAILDYAEPILLSDLEGDQTIQLSDEKGNPTQKIALSDAIEKMFEAFPKAARVDLKTHGTHKEPSKDPDTRFLSDDDAQKEADRILGKKKED